MPRELEELEKTEDTSLRAALEDAFDEAGDVNDEPDAGDLDNSSQSTDENGQPRDDQGRWTKAQREHFEAQQREQEGQQQEAQQQQQPEMRMAPPVGWSPAAKAAYAKLPPEVQEAVARREVEINNGFSKLKDYKGLEEYAEIARNSGTTLREAYDRYKAAEDLLDRDFRGGVMSLCEMYGIHPMQLANEFASIFSGQRGAPRAPAMDPQTGLIARELAGMKETVRTLISEREQQEQEAINSHLQSFSESKLYFEDVRQDMADLIRSGKANDLEEAYDKACWMNPQIRDLLIKEQAAPQNAEARVSRARRAAGSLITGAPAGSTSPSSSNSIRAALEDAWGDGAI
jgi:hypothetical protein